MARLSIDFSRRTIKRIASHARLAKKLFIARWRVPLFAFLAVIMLLPGGCGVFHRTVKGIPEDQAPAVRAGKKSVVLLRFAPRLDNTPVASVDKLIGSDFPFLFFWANVDRGRDILFFRAYSPSPEAAAEKWVYFLIPPGEYWIGLRRGRDPITWENANSRWNSFFLEVPEGVPLLYAGTLSVSCRPSRGLLARLDNRFDCGHVSIEDESEAAEIVAHRDVAELGPMETALLRPATPTPVAEEPGDLAPMGVILKGAPHLLTPEWYKRGVGRATGLGSETVAGLLGPPSSPGGQLSSFEAYGYLGYAMYLPFGAAAGLIGGQHSEQKWSPCTNMIAAEVANWSPPDALRTALVEALERRGVEDVTVVDDVSSVLDEEGQPRFRTLFEVEIQEVAFRECDKRWTFCGEMKVRGRLRDLATKRILYDGILIYSNGSRRYPFFRLFYTRPYEWLVNSDAMCRAIEDYCEPGGAMFFLEDLGAAVRFLADRLVLEAGVPAGGNGDAGAPSPEGVPSLPTSSILRVAP